jgi:RHS repeat-associated protein
VKAFPHLLCALLCCAGFPQGVLLYTHDAFGNLQSLQSTATNGVRLGYAHDALNRLETVTNTVAGSNWITRYAFDAAGNLRTNIPGNGLTNAYDFDSLNRLTNLVTTGPGGTVATFAYRLGPAGHRTNRQSSISQLPSASHSYGTNDTLTTDVYDLAGNTRTNGGNVFLYDREHRLTNATVGGTNVVIAYDADGNRVRKTVGSLTTLYLVDDRNPTGFAQVVEERTASGGVTNLARIFAHGLDLISQHDVAGGTTLYFGHDGLGSTRHLTTTNGTIANVFAYDAFGTLIASNAAPQTDHLFAGEQRDPHLGLDYLRARYLSTATGRFWTRDSFEGHWNDPPSLHKYTYAHNNPVNGSDPSGREFTVNSSLSGIAVAGTLVTINVALISQVSVNYQKFFRETLI